MLTLSDVQNRRTAAADIGLSDRMAALASLARPEGPEPAPSVRGKRRKNAAARASKDQTVFRSAYLIPIAMECGPTRCSTRVAEKPASRIQA
jgi:hypothetical protein